MSERIEKLIKQYPAMVLERDCIPALKEAFGVAKVQIIG